MAAFGPGRADRMDDSRYHSPPDEPPPLPPPPAAATSSYINFSTPMRSVGLARMQVAQPPSTPDARASLQRRFTTNAVPTLPTFSALSPIGQQRRQAVESSSAELTSAVSGVLVSLGCVSKERGAGRLSDLHPC